MKYFIKKFKLLFFTIFFIVTAFPVYSQDGLGSWNIINLKMNINDNWNVMGEAQLRSLQFYNQFHYYEFKTILGYNIDKNFSTSLGIGKYNTYSEGGNFIFPLQSDEVRTFFQLTMKQYLQLFKFEHRYRAEQRFTNKGYKNRFRYRINMTIPINKAKVENGAVYFNTWDEIFLTNQTPYFERNRLFLGFGYQLNENIVIQSGYIHQFDFKLEDEIGRDFFQISFQYEFDLINKKIQKEEHIPNWE